MERIRLHRLHRRQIAGPLRSGEGAAVELAGGSEGEARDRRELGRDEGLRQPLAEEVAQLGRRRLGTGGGEIPGDEPQTAAGPRSGLGNGQDHRLAYAGMAFERRLDLPRLHPHAAHLDLGVPPAQELDRPVGPAARQVARPVEASPGSRLRPGSGTKRSAVASGRPR